MIRFKSIREVFPNGLTWAHYHLEDIPNQTWYPALQHLLHLIHVDSSEGWQLIFSNFLSSLKSSVFYPVMTSFSDWESDYSIGSNLVKFNSQQGAIVDFFKADIGGGKEAGARIYPKRAGKGSRWLFGDQMPRVSSYSEQDLLNMLSNFANLGKAIPVAGWENSLTYGEKVHAMCDDYASYLESAYMLPPSWYIQQRTGIGSWLKTLGEAGVLRHGGLRTARGIRCIARDGHECNSLAELEIDNWLFERNIIHEKEPLYPVHKKYNKLRRLRADFKIGESYIEYAGLLDDPKYSTKINLKKQLATELKLRLIIIKPRNFGDLGSILGGL